MGAGQPAAGGGEPNFMMSMMPFVLIFAVFYFLIIRPQQKKEKDRRQMVASLKVGDTVITAGGLIGRIVETGENEKMIVDLGDSKVTTTRHYLTPFSDRKLEAAVQKKEPKKGKKGAKGAGESVAAAPATPEAPAAAENTTVVAESQTSEASSSKDEDKSAAS